MVNRIKSAFFDIRVLFLGLALVALFFFCVLPFFTLFERVLFPEGQFTLSLFEETFSSPAITIAIKNTLLVSSLVTITCMFIAVPLAWLLTRTDFPAARKFRSLLCLPFAIPPYIGAIAWIYLANPTTGLLPHLVGGDLFNIYSFTGLVFVEASFLYTFILLTTLSSLDRMDSSFEEAARLSGASPLRVFRDISLPLMRPSLISGGLLVFLATAASFGVPALIGGPARIYLMTTQIYTLQKMGSVSGILKAGALSSLLMVTALLTIFLSQFISRKAKFQTVSGKTSRPSVIELGKWKPLAVIGVLTFGFIVFVLPISGILISSLSKVQGDVGLSNFGFGNWYRVLFEVDETGRALFNSFILSAGAATLAVIVGYLVSYVQTKTRLPGGHLFDVIASLPYATPGTVVALALIMTFSGQLFGVLPSLYNTLGLILIAYFVKYLSFAVKTSADGFRQVDDVLAEASRVSGASWLQTMIRIWLPLLKPSLVAAWFLVFMPAMSELTMTTLLTGPGLETIGTLIFQLQEYADASGGGASVLALIVIIIVIAINYVVKRVSNGKYGL
ncbi:MAG: iron ABC transporter permease [Bdellovibrionota bacterium]